MAIRINREFNYDSTANYISKDQGDIVVVDPNNTTKSLSTMVGDGTQRGTYHMANNPHLYEVKRNNNFEFVVEFGSKNLLEAGLTIDASTLVNETQGNLDYISPTLAQEVLRMSVSSAFIPHFSQSPIAIKRGNSTLKYASTPEFQDGSLTLHDYIGADTKAIIMAWQNLSYNVRTEKVGLASDYKKTAHLLEYTPDHQLIRTWTLYGCWITGIQEGDYSSEDGGNHQITVNITYDKAFLESERVSIASSAAYSTNV